MNCPKCNSEVLDNHRFCPSCGHDLNKPIICPECNYQNESNSKFCQECGIPLINGVKQKSKKIVKDKSSLDEIEPVPDKGITIEFPFTTASSFEFAVKEAEKLHNFKKFGEGKNTLYRVTVVENEIFDIIVLVEQLKGWRKRTVYINGEKSSWDSVFSFYWCYIRKKSSYKPELFCFGYENEWDLNLWGCNRAGMAFSENSKWFTYGKWLNNKGDWEFDKARIKHELEKNLYDVRYCPAINFDFIQDIINALPDVVNPYKNNNWQFVENYDSDTSGGLVIKTKRYGFEDEVVVKGVCPKGKGFIKEIKSRMKLKIPDGLS
jgi:hypothetical protein